MCTPTLTDADLGQRGTGDIFACLGMVGEVGLVVGNVWMVRPYGGMTGGSRVSVFEFEFDFVDFFWLRAVSDEMSIDALAGHVMVMMWCCMIAVLKLECLPLPNQYPRKLMELMHAQLIWNMKIECMYREGGWKVSKAVSKYSSKNDNVGFGLSR